MRNYKLYIFDADGTLIRSFLREGAPKSDFDKIEFLPFVQDKISDILDVGGMLDVNPMIALMSNQGGVVHGYQTPDQVMEKLGKVADWLPQSDYHDVGIHVCFCHKKFPDAGKTELGDFRWDLMRRKPFPGMVIDAWLDARISFEKLGQNVELDDILVVGDLDSDAFAAQNAGVDFQWAHTFFGWDGPDGFIEGNIS